MRPHRLGELRRHLLHQVGERYRFGGSGVAYRRALAKAGASPDIARGVIAGPRMFVSTRAMAPTGTYPLLGYSWELKLPEGVQIVDGPEDIRKAVREEVKYGADWIKFYADYRWGPIAAARPTS